MQIFELKFITMSSLSAASMAFVGKLVFFTDPESYTGVVSDPGRFNHAGQVPGERPDKTPGPPGWGLGVGLTTPPSRNHHVTETATTSKIQETLANL